MCLLISFLLEATPDAWGFQVEFSPARRQDILLGGLVELRSIEICIEDCDLQDRQRHPLLLQSLARCCNLEEIKLGGRGIDSPAFEHTLNYIDFIDITPYLRGSKQASGIRKAHFHGCGLEERAFKSWLSCHSTTLRYFTLEDVSLHISDEQGDLIPVVEPMTYPDIPHLDHGPVVPQHQTSSWVRTFSFMSRTLRGLTFLELGGILSNCWSETYHVRKGLCKLGTMKRRVSWPLNGSLPHDILCLLCRPYARDGR